jgi:tRNA 2-selenouridine synthase
LQEAMREAPILLLEDTVANRVDRIFKQYVLEQLEEVLEPDPIGVLGMEFLNSLSAIQKRLGGDRYQLVQKLMADAFEAHNEGDTSGHYFWIEYLLTQYYDPMYEYQLERKQGRIMSRVDWQNVGSEQLLDLGANSREVL